MTETGAPPILTLRNVDIAYHDSGLLSLLGLKKPFIAARNICFELHRGETLALVGESGSGKSTIARAIAGLVTARAGEILYEGADINIPVRKRSRQLKQDLQIVFQNPDASLNPRHSIGFILSRAVRAFHDENSSRVHDRVLSLLQDVRLDASYAQRYPRQLSGGERQRVAIARALAAQPKVLLCDEILSALDVSVQSEIIDLLRALQADLGISILFISHDLAVVRWLADRVAVLLQGELCEIEATADIYSPPYHPYTKALLDAVPVIGRRLGAVPEPARR
jgi:peptide/nickel transport system ATP-binding protein